MCVIIMFSHNQIFNDLLSNPCLFEYIPTQAVFSFILYNNMSIHAYMKGTDS